MDKKKMQLGMNPSTASHRLVKDLLWHLAARHEACYHCGQSMTRETFSIEHKTPWLDSEDPVGMYFDMENIAFSHFNCNSGASRNPNKKFETDEQRQEAQASYQRKHRRKHYCPEKRRAKYLKNGT